MMDRDDMFNRAFPIPECAEKLHYNMFAIQLRYSNCKVLESLLGVRFDYRESYFQKTESVSAMFYPVPKETFYMGYGGGTEETSGIYMSLNDRLVFSPCGAVFACAAEDFVKFYSPQAVMNKFDDLLPSV